MQLPPPEKEKPQEMKVEEAPRVVEEKAGGAVVELVYEVWCEGAVWLTLSPNYRLSSRASRCRCGSGLSRVAQVGFVHIVVQLSFVAIITLRQNCDKSASCLSHAQPQTIRYHDLRTVVLSSKQISTCSRFSDAYTTTFRYPIADRM